MKITAAVNQKGGVGKTATTLNVGGALAEGGARVLLVDLDPQGHLTHTGDRGFFEETCLGRGKQRAA